MNPAYFPPKPLLEQFKRHEDLRLVLYLCPKGKITGGWGHNFEARPVPGIPAVLGQRLSLDQAERLLVTDVMLDGAAVLSRWPWAGGLDPARLAVLVNMSFNMGVDGLAGFHKTLSLVQAGDYAGAAQEMLRSDWALQVAEKLNMLPFIDAQKASIATIANDIEKLNRDATHMSTMAGLTGVGAYEAQIAGIKAKYDALRQDPKTSQHSVQWDVEQEAALARAGQDRAKALAQQRGELAQLTNNTKEYYAAQAEVLTIERDLAATTEERAIKQQQLDKATAQMNGDAMDGMGRSLRAYGAEASDVWQNFYRAGTNAAAKVEDALTDALSMQDVDLESLMQSLGAEMTRAAIVRPMLGKLTEMLGSTGLFGDLGKSAETAALTTAAVGLDTSSIALETSAIALDTSAFALDTSAMGLDAAAMALDAAAMSLGAGGVTSSGGDGSSLLGSVVGSFFNLDGFFADGGHTGAGRILVGERGPEILELGGSGYVYNNAETQAMLSGSGGASISSSHVTIHQSFDFRGADTGTETRLRIAAGIIKKQAVAEALAQVKALSDRGGKFSRTVGRRT